MPPKKNSNRKDPKKPKPGLSAKDEDLRESEAQYRYIVENINEVFYRIDNNGVFTYISPNSEVYFQYKPEEIIGKPFKDFILEEDFLLAKKNFLDIVSGGKKTTEYRAVKKNGDSCWIRVSGRPIETENTISGIQGIITDVTERRMFEKALKESEEKYRVLVEKANDTIIIIQDSSIKYINHKLASMDDSELDRIIGKNFLEYVHPDERPKIIDLHRKRISGEPVPSIYETILLNEKGENIYTEVNVSETKFNGRPANLIIVRDITDRKKTETALKESRERLRRFFEASFEGLLIHDQGKIIDGNQVMANLVGFDIENDNTKNIFDFIAPESRAVILKNTLSNYENPYEAVLMRKDGTRINVEIQAKTITYKNRSMRVAAIHDITLRKKIEEDLASEKERLIVTLKSIGDGVITTDIGGRVLLMNEVAEKLTEWKQEDASGHPFNHIFKIENINTKTPAINPVEQVLNENTIVNTSDPTILVSRTGTTHYISNSGAPIRDRNNNIVGVIVVFRDISEKYRTEIELQKTQRLESIGILAGGIAHDFNNLLTGISGNISLSKLLAAHDNQLLSLMNEAEKAIFRARDLTQQLLTFSRGGMPVKKTALIAEIIRESSEFVLRGSNVKCEFNLSTEPITVEVDTGQIGQVIQNLVINAAQSMASGGQINIVTEKCLVSQTNPLPLAPGTYAKISIIDQGCGIDNKNIEKIFDPYFTTKETGNGLGLSIAYSIIKKHNGHITVTSEKDKGSTFIFYLPVSKSMPVRPESSRKKIHPSSGKILVMDDDEIIRKIADKLLSQLGYTVECVSDGKEAIRVFQQHRDSNSHFDIILLDLTVPGGMGGLECSRELQKIDPSCHIIVSSGYSNDPIMADFKKYGLSGMIAKPYRLEELREVLQRVHPPYQEETDTSTS